MFTVGNPLTLALSLQGRGNRRKAAAACFDLEWFSTVCASEFFHLPGQGKVQFGNAPGVVGG